MTRTNNRTAIVTFGIATAAGSVLVAVAMVVAMSGSSRTTSRTANGSKSENPRPVASGSKYRSKVAAYLSENVNDPKKLEIVSISGAYPSENCRVWTGTSEFIDVKNMDSLLWKPPVRPGVAVAVKFRSTNGLGALVLSEQWFLFDRNDKIYEVVSTSDFRTSPHKRTVDHAMGEFTDSLGIK